MKRRLSSKIATTLCMLVAVAVPFINVPNSFVLWGEPTPPLKKED